MKFKAGDRVDVDWSLNVNTNKNLSGYWKDKLVVRVQIFGDNKQYLFLEGHPLCPACYERCKIHLKNE